MNFLEKVCTPVIIVAGECTLLVKMTLIKILLRETFTRNTYRWTVHKVYLPYIIF